MKLYSIFILSCLSVISWKCRTKETLDKVTVIYVPLATKAPVVVECDELKKVFGKKLKSFVIEGPESLRNMEDLFAHAVSAKFRTVNVRAKFILQYRNHTETYCMDREGTLEGYDFLWCPQLVEWMKNLK